jgi:hypothetical protein
MRPRFVPLDGVEGEGKTATPPPDAFSGITQRRLQNGIRVNYRCVRLNALQQPKI